MLGVLDPVMVACFSIGCGCYILQLYYNRTLQFYVSCFLKPILWLLFYNFSLTPSTLLHGQAYRRPGHCHGCSRLKGPVSFIYIYFCSQCPSLLIILGSCFNLLILFCLFLESYALNWQACFYLTKFFSHNLNQASLSLTGDWHMLFFPVFQGTGCSVEGRRCRWHFNRFSNKTRKLWVPSAVTYIIGR